MPPRVGTGGVTVASWSQPKRKRKGRLKREPWRLRGATDVKGQTCPNCNDCWPWALTHCPSCSTRMR